MIPPTLVTARRRRCALAAIAVFCVRHYAAGHPLDTALKFPFGLFFAPAIWIGWLLDTTLFS